MTQLGNVTRWPNARIEQGATLLTLVASQVAAQAIRATGSLHRREERHALGNRAIQLPKELVRLAFREQRVVEESP